MGEKVVEQLAMRLHEWYLESIQELDPSSYNPKARVEWYQLTEQQKQIDRFIARKLLEGWGVYE